MLDRIYRPSLALLTDLYQLTMGYGYWKTGAAEREAVFNLFFRRNPFKGGYAVCAGLANAIEYLESFAFDAGDLDFLATLVGNDGRPLFEQGFLDYLGAMRFECDVHAIPEGEVVFPHEPLLRVQGPLLQCQLIETPLLNMVNFQTLVATKAARVCLAAQGEPVLEFGLRRAQGVDGALGAARAAFIGGCTATSNVLAARLYGIPVKGTHAHSWVMTFDDELTAFRRYAEAMPNNCVFLVDTYDTLEGVRNAVIVGKELREQGHEMVGIRLDSGDLASLSVDARRILDEGGFPEASIVASNDLDEYAITRLEQQHAEIGVWGVGTRLVTAYDQPALGGVYKLSAVREPGAAWVHKIKLSEQAIKVSNPGIQQVRRFTNGDGTPVADVIYDLDQGFDPRGMVLLTGAVGELRDSPSPAEHRDLLVPVFQGGRRCYDLPALADIRATCLDGLHRFDPAVLRVASPIDYPVALDLALHELKSELIEAAGD